MYPERNLKPMMNTPIDSRLRSASMTTSPKTKQMDTTSLSSTRILTLLALLGILAAQPLVADQVSYSDDPTPATTYDKTALLLNEVFGSSDPTSGDFTETYPPSFIVNGNGMQDVTFNFLYEDGGYTFEFGYFVMTDELLGMSTDTVNQKRAFANAALENAHTIIVDRNYSGSAPSGAFKATADPTWTDNPSDPDDYMGTRSSVNSTTVQIMGGTRIEFFIIPNNTLANFQSNPNSFGLTDEFGSAWPLFSYSDANPGSGTRNNGSTNGSGEGYDQVMTFDGTTAGDLMGNGQETGTMVAFEDVRRINNSDEDFSDLIFFIGNVSSETAVPEPATVFAGALLTLGLGLTILRRRRLIGQQLL